MTGLEATERAIREHLAVLWIVTGKLAEVGEDLATSTLLPDVQSAADVVLGITRILEAEHTRMREMQGYLAEQISKENGA